MSLERVLKILENFGLAKTDAKVYVYLAKKGPKRKKELTDEFKLTDQQLYASLKNLLGKGVVIASVEKFALFSALDFERVLDLFVKANMEQAQAVKENKEEILANWRSMTKRGDSKQAESIM